MPSPFETWEYNGEQVPIDPNAMDDNARRWQRGQELFEQLKNVDSGSAAITAVYSDALADTDLRAIVLHCIFAFRQAADSPDDYAEWSGS